VLFDHRSRLETAILSEASRYKLNTNGKAIFSSNWHRQGGEANRRNGQQRRLRSDERRNSSLTLLILIDREWQSI